MRPDAKTTLKIRLDSQDGAVTEQTAMLVTDSWTLNSFECQYLGITENMLKKELLAIFGKITHFN